MNELVIDIPLQVERIATPNGRGHWGAKKRATDHMRDTTLQTMQATMDLNDSVACFQESPWPLTLDYEIQHGKGRKRLDDDNAIAAMKPIRDAIASAFGIDDRHFLTGTMTQTRDKTGKGRIIVTIRDASDIERIAS